MANRLHDNPYGAEEGEGATGGTLSLVRRMVSTALLTIGVIFAIPGMPVMVATLYVIIGRRPFRMSTDDIEFLAFALFAFVVVPVLFIVTGLRMRRSRRRNTLDLPR